MKLPITIRNWLINKVKSWDPRYTDAYMSDRQGFGVPSDQNLEANVEAIQYSIWPYICINKTADNIAGLPLKFYVGKGDKKREVPDHAIAKLIRRPNPVDTHRDLWIDTVWGLLSAGTSIWSLNKMSLGDKVVPGKTEIWTLPPEKTQPIWSKEKGLTGYKVTTPTGKVVNYTLNEIVRFKKFNPKNQFYGLATMTIAQRTLAADFYAREWNRKFFKNDASAGKELKTKASYNKDLDERLKAAWAASHQGVANAHRLEIYWGDMEPVGSDKRNPKDLDFLKLIKLNREEIIALFGIPPAVVGLFEYAHYANAMMQKKEFWAETLLPMILHFETTLNELVFPQWTDEEFWMEFDVSDVEALQEDENDKAERATKLHDSGIMTANEIRSRDYNMEPIEGGDELKKPGIPLGLSVEPTTLKTYDLQTDEWWQKDINRRKLEGKFFDEMKGFFVGQKSRVLKILSGFPEDYTVDESNVDTLFPELQEQQLLEDQTSQLFKDAIKTAGQAAIDEVKPKKSIKRGDEPEIIGDFDITSPEVAYWIENKVARFVVRVNDSTKAKIRDIVSQGYDEGWTMRELSESIGSTFDDFGKARSLRISQTEMGSAANAGSMQGYRQSGVVQKKGWLSARDSLVRESHAMAESEGAIGLDEKFSNGLDCPGDLSGPAEEVINCRCSITPIVEV